MHCFLYADGFCYFVVFGKLGYSHLQLEACLSMPQHNKFFWGPLVPASHSKVHRQHFKISAPTHIFVQ